MRFILFNIAVAAALVYLFKGGELTAPDLQALADQAKAKVEAVVADNKGHGRDVIRAPKPVAPKPKPAPKPRQTESNPKPKAAPPALAKPVDVALRPQPKPVPGAMKIPPVPPAPPEVAQRRAEVLDEAAPKPTPQPPVALKEGTQMMSAAERRRELNALAEEMEMLYITKVGG